MDFRPEEPPIPNSDIYVEHFLNENNIRFERFDHLPVFTCEQANSLKDKIPGIDTKNLFLRTENGDHFFLVSVTHSKRVNLKALGLMLGVGKLTFASESSLLELLGVRPGSVTLLGLIFDRDRKIRTIIDSAIWNADALQCHPLVNTSTFVIALREFQRFLSVLAVNPMVIDVPAVGPATFIKPN